MFDKILGRNNEEKAMLNAEARQEAQVHARDAFMAAQTDSDYTTPQEARGDIIRWQQDLTDEIDILKRRLRGEHFNGETWVKKTRRVVIEELYN